MSEKIRIDKWLWAARFFKTRSLAVQAVEGGRVTVDGERVKPAREARIGDRLELTQGEMRVEVFIRALSDIRGSAVIAQKLFEETPESIVRRAQRADTRRFAREPAATLKGRPTKREGRALRRLGEQA